MIEIGVLGALQLVVGGSPTSLPGRRERALLSILAVQAAEVVPLAVSVGKLAEHLWGDAPPRTWHKALQTAVSNIRNVVETAGGTDSGWLETTDSGYRLAVPAEAIDLRRFQSQAARGREQLRNGHVAGARRSFVEALALWRAEEPADMGDGVAASVEAARLRELRVAVLADRLDADLAAGGHDDVVVELQALCERWPDRERFHEQLMLALYRDGRQAESLAVAAQLRSGLVERHGLDPGSGIRELEERILAQDPQLLTAPESSRASAASLQAAAEQATADQTETSASPASRLASGPASGPLVGRDRDLYAITAALQHARLVTLVGPGGVGKTSLAAVVADQAAGTGVEVAWCSLGDVLQLDNLVPALSTTLAVPQRKDVTMREGILQRLRAGRMLLVIDNCEHLLDGVAELVAELVSTCPDLRVLATSRERLGLAAEHVWPLEGLSLPESDGAAVDSPAVQLFLDRAVRSDGHFRADDAVLAAITAICRALDGNPLALELAAARVRAIPATEIATRLDARFELLTGRRGTNERHHSLRAAVEWSYDLLGDRQRKLFRRLGTFAGPFTMAAATAVAALDDLDQGEIALLLADLVDKSIVAVNGDHASVRYRLLETMRVFAREERDRAGEAAASDDAFLAHMVAQVQELDDRLTGPEELEAIEVAAQTFDNVRHAVALARERGEHQLLGQILSGLVTYLRFRVNWEASTWFQAAAQVLAADASADRGMVNRIVGTAAWGLWLGGELDAANVLVTQARLESDPHEPNLVYVLAAAAVVEMYRNDATNIATATQALALAEANGGQWLAAYLLGATALTHAYSGDIAEATALLNRQAALVTSLDNDTARAWWLYCSAEVSGDRDPGNTLDLARQACALARRTKASLIENIARITVVSIAARHGSPADAINEFTEVIQRCWRQGAWTHLQVTVHNLIELLAALGGDEYAVTLLHSNPEGATEAYGDQRQRLDSIAATLAERLSEQRYRAAAAAGQQLPRDGVARTALEALAVHRSDRHAD